MDAAPVIPKLDNTFGALLVGIIVAALQVFHCP